MNDYYTSRDRLELAVLEAHGDADLAARVGELCADTVENVCLALEAATGLPKCTFAPAAWSVLEAARD